MALFKNITKNDLLFSLNPQGDFIISPGATAELPEKNDHIKTLEASGYIKKVINPSKSKK